MCVRVRVRVRVCVYMAAHASGLTHHRMRAPASSIRSGPPRPQCDTPAVLTQYSRSIHAVLPTQCSRSAHAGAEGAALLGSLETVLALTRSAHEIRLGLARLQPVREHPEYP